jgi:hypothetical protein
MAGVQYQSVAHNDSIGAVDSRQVARVALSSTSIAAGNEGMKIHGMFSDHATGRVSVEDGTCGVGGDEGEDSESLAKAHVVREDSPSKRGRPFSCHEVCQRALIRHVFCSSHRLHMLGYMLMQQCNAVTMRWRGHGCWR